MSRALSPPWILKYLLDVAVTYGGDLIGVPFFMANKKVQLTKVSVASSRVCFEDGHTTVLMDIV